MDGKAIIFGVLTIDENIYGNKKFISPGGSAFYCTKTLENLEVDPTVISPYGEDFPKKCLLKTTFFPINPSTEKTLSFKNIYTQDDARNQWIANYQQAEFIKIEKIPEKFLKNKDIVILAPLINNITSEEIFDICAYYKKSLKILLPQGLYRKIYRGGKIIHQNWTQADKITPYFDIILLSDKDFPEADKLALDWNKAGPIIVITRGRKGCSIFHKQKKFRLKALSVSEINNPTGAGDIFTSAFAYAFFKSREVVGSGVFANAVASYSLRFLPDQLQYSYQDIVDFAVSQNIDIKL